MLKVVKKQSIWLQCCRVFKIVLTGWGDFLPVGKIVNFAGRIFLLGGENLTRSDFDNLQVF